MFLSKTLLLVILGLKTLHLDRFLLLFSELQIRLLITVTKGLRNEAPILVANKSLNTELFEMAEKIMESPVAITFQPDIYDKVLDLLPKNPSLKILDVGAGQGFFSRKVKDIGLNIESCDFLEDNFKCPDIPFIKKGFESIHSLREQYL